MKKKCLNNGIARKTSKNDQKKQTVLYFNFSVQSQNRSKYLIIMRPKLYKNYKTGARKIFRYIIYE